MTDNRQPSTRGSYPRRLGHLDPPETVKEIVARLERAGFETWCVGGAVRDALLGHPHLDWDFATVATPAQVMGVFKRTVPVGVEFGTVGVFDSQNTMHEVTTFRRDVNTDGRHAVVEFGASLDDDLARRDFTVNAIAYHPKTGELRDPFEGQLDLQRGLIRAVGTAGERMREDRLRALRGIRFASRFSFHIEPATWTAIRDSAPHMGRLSPERVKQELEKTMEQVGRPSIALEWWREAGFLKALVPSIAAAPAERFTAVDHLPRGEGAEGKGATLNRLAMLFFGESESAGAAATKALRFSNADASWISALAGARAELGQGIDAAIRSGPLAAVEVRRWVARIGRMRTETFFQLTTALWKARLAAREDAAVESRLSELSALAVIIAFRDPIAIADLAVDGEDLQKAGIPNGPRMGKVLHALLERVIEDPSLNTNAQLLQLAKTL
jgi:tRNA nucleotidyltransferase (CCA-adding enzyme)